MELRISGLRGSDGEVVAYGSTYQFGIETGKYKLFIEQGVLNPKSVREGAVFIVSTDWVKHMIDINKITAYEV